MGIPVNSYFNTSTAITATTLAGLLAGTGYALPGISNISSSVGGMVLRVYFLVTTGTNPIANGTIQFYLLQGDANPPNIYTDGAPTAGGTYTPISSQLVAIVPVTSTSNQKYYGSFVIRNPGPYWGIAVYNNTGVALYGTASSTYFLLNYVTESIST